MTNSRFYKIWRGEEVYMVEWYQPVSDSMIPNLSIPESRLPNIDQAEKSNEQSSVFSTHQINKVG